MTKKMLSPTISAYLLVLVLLSAKAGRGMDLTRTSAGLGAIAYIRSNDNTGDEIRVIIQLRVIHSIVFVSSPEKRAD